VPRRVHPPPFPDTPGKWLACYRYRWQPGGKACSPEHLGSVLGVSGTTVRRWEAGQLRPTRQDLSRIAAICELTALEESFLLQAFQARHVEIPPPFDAFEKMAMRAQHIHGRTGARKPDAAHGQRRRGGLQTGTRASS
jgi:hypothetical protein